MIQKILIGFAIIAFWFSIFGAFIFILIAYIFSNEDLVRNTNIQNSEYYHDYILVRNGNCINERKIINHIERACRAINISAKGMHKIRKTYISALIDEGLNLGKGNVRTKANWESRSYSFVTKPEKIIQCPLA